MNLQLMNDAWWVNVKRASEDCGYVKVILWWKSEKCVIR